MARVKLVGLTKEFEGKKALDNVTLEIKDRSFTCIFGPPGVGKSTLLKTIAGLVELDSGKVYIDDQDITNMPPKERGVGMVFEGLALYPHMSVFDNIASPLKLAKVPRDDIGKKVRTVCELLKAGYLLDRKAKPSELSGGEAQRVAIARAIVREAKVYLFDEPLTDLDYKIREDMRGELKRMREELGQTIIYATPDPVEALTMADEVAVMNGGKVEQFGLVDELYRHPANVYVGANLGYPPMNIINCNLLKKGKKLFLDAGPFQIDVTPLKDKIEAGATGSELILGLRPEYIEVSDKPAKGEAVSIEAKVYLQEVIGSESILHAKVENLILKTLIDRTYRVEMGAGISLNFDLSDIHIFDKATGVAIV